MNKKILIGLCLLCSFYCIFALDHKESGRESVTAILATDSIPASSKVDTKAYLDDFAFPYRAQKSNPLSFFVHPSQSSVLSNGEEIVLQVGLRANNKDFFEPRDINYLIYINNPSFVASDRGKNLFTNALKRMLEAKTKDSCICLYSISDGLLKYVTSPNDIAPILNQIGSESKPDNVAKVLMDMGKSVEINSNGMPWRIMCISDDDMFKSEAVRNVFLYIPRVYNLNYNDISFSYIGYGIVSDWPLINQVFASEDGNIYYEKTYKALENRIFSDFDKFSHYDIQDIDIRISYYPWVSGAKDLEFSIPSMEYDGHKIILDAVNLPSLVKLPIDSEFIENYKNSDGSYKTAMVSVNYVYGKDKTPMYKTDIISVKYTDNPQEVANSKNAVVEQSIVLSETGKIFSQLEDLYNSGNYVKALDMINSQIQALKKIQENSKDRQIEVEIQNLKKAFELIHEKLMSESSLSE